MTPYERWVACRAELDQAAVQGKWVRFEELLVAAKAIADLGKVENLWIALTSSDDDLT